MVNINRARHAVFGEVGVSGAEHQHAVDFAGVDLDPERIARPERVLLLQPERQPQAVTTGITGTQAQAAGGFFNHIERQIHLIGRARHFLRFNRDFREIAQAVDPVARAADLVAVVPRRLQLPEFAPHHHVPRAGVACDVDLAHIGAPRRVGLQRDGHAAVDAVDFGHRLDTRERVTEIAKIVGKGLAGFGDFVGVVGLTRTNGNESFEFIVLAQVVARQLDAADHKALALGDVDGDANVSLVRIHRHLGGVDLEFKVTARQVVRAQRFNVGVELGA